MLLNELIFFSGLGSSEDVPGKLSAYLKSNKPHQYECLVKAHILPYIHGWSAVT